MEGAAEQRGGIRLCLAAGALLVFSGLLYGAVFLIRGDGWTGPTSLRKPLLFGLSTGVTLLSVGWVLGGLVPRKVDPWLYGSLALALVLEVGLIDLQQARGVPSHFNRSTPFDAAITGAMGGLILFATAVIAEITLRAWRRLAFDPSDTFVARFGLVMLLAACALGIGITSLGEARADRGLDPTTWGRAGVPKFAHGMPLHAIQIAWVQNRLLAALGVSEPRRLASLRWTAGGLVLATVYAVVQTAIGAPRFPPVGPTWPLAIGSAIAFVVALGVSRPRRSATPSSRL
jgi:hypothetical protein